MPERRKAPPIHAIRSLHLPPIKRVVLDNGLPIDLIRGDSHEVLKMDLIFRAGRPYEKKPLVARTTQLMLREGSEGFSGEEIAEHLDFHGSSLRFPFQFDTAHLVVYTLRRHFPKMLALLSDLVQRPTFPERERQQLIDRSIAQLHIETEKNDVIAYRRITELLYGSYHPYGYNSQPEYYHQLNREDLLNHFGDLYHAGNARIILAGRVEEAEEELLNQYFGSLPTKARPEAPDLPVSGPSPAFERLPGGGQMQNAVRLGRRLFNRHHPDYSGLYVLNTLLGGYFGSRLMTNIREEKGYTYNIYSSLDPLRFDGSWLISCEVGKEHTQASLDEIFSEMRLLREEPVSKEELEMVRNYLLGNFLTMLDGPLNTLDLVSALIADELDTGFFQKLIDRIAHIQAGELQALAQKYLSEKDWISLIVEGNEPD